MKTQRKERTVKTSVDLPEPLWRSVKIRAIDEGSDLRTIVIEALELYLKQKPRKEGVR